MSGNGSDWAQSGVDKTGDTLDATCVAEPLGRCVDFAGNSEQPRRTYVIAIDGTAPA